MDAAAEAAVVVEEVRVVEDQEFIGGHQTMQPSFDKTQRDIAGHMGDATITLWIVQDRRQGITTRPQGKIACQDQMHSVNLLSDGERRHYLLGIFIK